MPSSRSTGRVLGHLRRDSAPVPATGAASRCRRDTLPADIWKSGPADRSENVLAALAATSCDRELGPRARGWNPALQSPAAPPHRPATSCSGKPTRTTGAFIAPRSESGAAARWVGAKRRTTRDPSRTGRVRASVTLGSQDCPVVRSRRVRLPGGACPPTRNFSCPLTHVAEANSEYSTSATGP